MPKNASDDEAWAEQHTGECAVGFIAELRSVDPPGKPFEPVRGPLGFCVDPSAYRRKRRRKMVASGSAPA